MLKSPLRAIRTAGSVGGARSNPRVYPTWVSGLGEECLRGGSALRQSVCVCQSAGELPEVGELGSHGVGFVCQALRAWAFSLSPGGGQTRTEPASLPAALRRHCPWRTALNVRGRGHDVGGAGRDVTPARD